METATRGTLGAIGGQLALIVGAAHLGLWLFFVLARPAVVAGDPRVLVWLLAGALLVGGTAVAALGRHPRWLHAAGAGLVGLLVAGHLLWPATVGGNLYLGAVGGPPIADPVGYLAARLMGGRTVTKVIVRLELLLFAVLFVLVADGEPR